MKRINYDKPRKTAKKKTMHTETNLDPAGERDLKFLRKYSDGLGCQVSNSVLIRMALREWKLTLIETLVKMGKFSPAQRAEFMIEFNANQKKQITKCMKGRLENE